jgi:cobalt-zinc-cadmium efflux system outer membrane protein
MLLESATVGLAVLWLAQAPTPAPLTLSEALQRAAVSNPSLAAARVRLTTLAAGVDVARERPNPELAFELERETPRESYTLSLPVETAAKRARRIAAASASIDVARAEIAALELETRVAVRRAFAELVAAQRRAEAAKELQALSTRAVTAAHARVEAGDAPRLEALQTELAAAEADNDLVTRSGELQGARVELGALLGATGTSYEAVAGPAIAQPLDAAALGQAAIARSVDLAVIDRRLAESSARMAVARSLQVPDVRIDGAVTHRAQPEFAYGWRAGADVTMPLFTRHRAGVAVESGVTAELQAERTAIVERTRGAVMAAAARAAALQDQAARFETAILPRAREIEAMAEDAYRSGQTGLVALLQTIGTAREIRTRAIEADRAYQLAVADLERAVGVPLQ